MDARDLALTDKELRSLLAARRRARRIAALQRLTTGIQEGAGQPVLGTPEPGNLPLPQDEADAQRQKAARLPKGERTRPAGLAAIGAQPALSGKGVWRAGEHALGTAPAVSEAWEGARSLVVPRLQPLPRHAWLARLPLRLSWALWRDRILLLVEIAALLALIFVVAGSFSSLDTLNQEIAEARKSQVEAIAVADEELPGSSFPPALGGELPAPVRPLIRPGAPVPIPTPPPQAATRIVIPAIGVDSVVVEGDSWEDLKKGVGHHIGTAHPGERGNAVYSGHNDVFGEVFRRLEELRPGDLITMYAGANLYRYEVKRVRVVGPKEVNVMAPTPDATLTLITCYPYRVDTHRLVVVAKLVE